MKSGGSAGRKRTGRKKTGNVASRRPRKAATAHAARDEPASQGVAAQTNPGPLEDLKLLDRDLQEGDSFVALKSINAVHGTLEVRPGERGKIVRDLGQQACGRHLYHAMVHLDRPQRQGFYPMDLILDRSRAAVIDTAKPLQAAA